MNLFLKGVLISYDDDDEWPMQVVTIATKREGRMFLIHYLGWNKKSVRHSVTMRQASRPRCRWDEWVPLERTLEKSERNMRVYNEILLQRCV